jgi:hypothetical protein
MVNANRRLAPASNECGIPVLPLPERRRIRGPQTSCGLTACASLDGDRVRGSKFEDAGVAASDPAKHVDLLGVCQAVGNGIGNHFQ